MTQVPEKSSIDEALEHYGVRGMHWGVRKSKATTGVSRSSGALIDRNARQRQLLKDARSGAYAPHMVALGKKILGEKKWESNFKTSMKNLKAQDTRLRTGKLTALDHLDKLGNINVTNLVISRTPKK